jgi:cell division protein FtsW (lipid II flippase)
MRSPLISLLPVAVPAVAAGLAVLVLADVGRGVWLIQGSAIALACVLVLADRMVRPAFSPPHASIVIIGLALTLVAAPLSGEATRPERWLSLGPVSLYVAPLCLPSFLAACSFCLRERGGLALTALVAAAGMSALLAAQPDASQALALLVASAVLFVRDSIGIKRSAAALMAMALIAGYAFSRPDPLESVPYVEGVFILAFEHSVVAGLFVVAGAFALVGGLWLRSLRNNAWLAAASAYYAVLFACSVPGLTPAPLVGYGAAPLLGFGLMVAVLRTLEPRAAGAPSIAPP